MIKKIDLLRNYAENKQWYEALKIASKFPRLGNEKVAIVRAYECIVHPQFYLSLGYNLDEQIDLGITALCKRYDIIR